eukprot:GEMP01062157.1.p1 GENE.GEMP01062157.1~~GEMP01062157.1.p1  ORF type:complete len:118 (+),score=2.66 GEMP01062157.1:741-1094(+)
MLISAAKKEYMKAYAIQCIVQYFEFSQHILHCTCTFFKPTFDRTSHIVDALLEKEFICSRFLFAEHYSGLFVLQKDVDFFYKDVDFFRVVYNFFTLCFCTRSVLYHKYSVRDLQKYY